MSLKETAQKTFTNFWNIDLGHVIVAVTFLVGLVGAWEKMGARIESVSVSEATHFSVADSALKAAVGERNLKLDALEARMSRAESDVRTVGDLKTSVAVIGTELNSLAKEISGLRLEIKEQALARRAATQ